MSGTNEKDQGKRAGFVLAPEGRQLLASETLGPREACGFCISPGGATVPGVSPWIRARGFTLDQSRARGFTLDQSQGFHPWLTTVAPPGLRDCPISGVGA